MSGKVGEQVEIAQDERAFRDDGDRVATAGEDREDAARHFEPFLERLVAVGVDSESDRLADVGPLGKFGLENLHGIGLVEQLGLEIEPG
jgi:hypothetical protein